jgi:hypothetical protein
MSTADRIAERLLGIDVEPRHESAADHEPLVAAGPTDHHPVPGHESAGATEVMDSDGHGKWALLIGINKYPKLPAASQLRGCINDVDAIEAVLTSDRFGFPVGNVLKLVDAQATREGILTAFKTHLVENLRIREGDAVVVYFSGHGSRIKDMHGDEESGYDQTLVPYDAGRKSADDVRDITDDELSVLLDKLSQRTQNINLFFDSCHSGTITRAVEDALDHDVEGLARWVEPWAADVPRQLDVQVVEDTRGMGPSEWLPLSEGYVLIAGCQSEERSREFAFQTGLLPVQRKQHGALTFYLLQSLAAVGTETTYYDIWDQIRVQVSAKSPDQHPQIEGAYERLVFGGTALPRGRSVPVLERTSDSVTLQAGLSQGATAGSRFAIYPHGTQSFENDDVRLAIVRLSDIDAFCAVAQLEDGDLSQVQVGAPAVEIEHNYGTMQLAVHVTGAEPVLEVVRKLIDVSPLLRLVTDEDTEHSAVRVRLRLALLTEGGLETAAGPLLEIVSSADGRSLVQPIAPEGGAAELVLEKLEHIAKYTNILAIRNHDPQSTLTDRVKVRLKKIGQDSSGAEAFSEVERTQGGEIVLRVGDRVVLEVENDSDQSLHVTILDCNTEWQVKPIFPPAGATDDVVPTKRSRRTNRFMVNLPEHQKRLTGGHALPHETVKLMATTERIDFRSLWLPAMRGDDRRLDAVEGSHSSLFQILDHAIGGGTEPATRSLDEYAGPVFDDWTTSELVFRIDPVTEASD